MSGNAATYSSGKLGYGNTDNIGTEPGSMNKSVDVNLGANYSVESVAVGKYHSCALSMDHVIKCWGWNYFGMIGTGSSATIGNGPGEMGDNMTAVDLGDFVPKSINCGPWHCCSISTTSLIKCWGLYLYHLSRNSSFNHGNLTNIYLSL